MFSWITGPRITNVVEDLQSDPALDTTFVEPPETPAPVFVARAFKHAIFGTPAPEEFKERPSQRRRNSESTDRRPTELAINGKTAEFLVGADHVPLSSPTKPNGILMTPGTAAKGRKTVSFGAQVVDNEGKKAVGRSGIPNDCPGKFPSPWTPGTELLPEKEKEKDQEKDKGKVKDKDKDKKPQSRLTAALYGAKNPSPAKPDQKPKAKDDNDITVNMMEPRSDSGKFWKDQYLSYAEKTEHEVKKLVTKQQLAKNYARKKDTEAMELAAKLSEERKRHKAREKTLEQQTKDYQERLRQAMAENLRASMEIAGLKSRVAALESSAALLQQDSKPSFQIHEDSSKGSLEDSIRGPVRAPVGKTKEELTQKDDHKMDDLTKVEQSNKPERVSIDHIRRTERTRDQSRKRTESIHDNSSKKTESIQEQQAPPLTEAPAILLGKPMRRDTPALGKENSPQRPRRLRRNTASTDCAPTAPAVSTAPANPPDLLSGVYNLSNGTATRISLPFSDSSPLTSRESVALAAESALKSRESLVLPAKSPLNARSTNPNASKENIPPSSSFRAQFSPLNQHPPSPDPWMQLSDFNDSPLPQKVDRMALPVGSAPPPPQPTRRATTNSFARADASRGIGNSKGEAKAPPPKEQQKEGNEEKKKGPGCKDEKLSVDRKVAAKERLARKRLQKHSPESSQ